MTIIATIAIEIIAITNPAIAMPFIFSVFRLETKAIMIATIERMGEIKKKPQQERKVKTRDTIPSTKAATANPFSLLLFWGVGE